VHIFIRTGTIGNTSTILVGKILGKFVSFRSLSVRFLCHIGCILVGLASKNIVRQDVEGDGRGLH
jgi:hypothetical protein